MRHARTLSFAPAVASAVLSACVVAHAPDADTKAEVAEQSAAVTVAPPDGPAAAATVSALPLAR